MSINSQVGTILAIIVLLLSISALSGEKQNSEIIPNFDDWQIHGKGTKEKLASNNVELTILPSSEGFGYWLSCPMPLQASFTYCLKFDMFRTQNSNGSPETGLSSYNEHLGWQTLHNRWLTYKFIFETPDKIIAERSALRFGQYGMTKGKILYKNIRLYPIRPKYRKFGLIELGTGEIIYDNCYQFITRFLVYGNHSRPLKSFQCAFNTNRWVFFKNDYVIYKHYLDGITQISGRIELHIDWRNKGKIIVEVYSEKTGNEWINIGKVAKTGEISFSVPKNCYPARTLNVRLRATSGHKFKGDFDPGTIQLGAYRYFAKLDKTFNKILKGKTNYRRK